MPTLLGVFERPDQIAAAIRRLRDRGYNDIETYAPAPFSEVDDALIGGLTGVVTGYALTLWMANNWQIMVGGKPFSSVTPYTIIAFELTILFGVLMTVLGVFIFGKLPKFKLDAAYHPRFSAEDFGLAVRCQERDVAEIDGLLRDHHAMEVSLVEG
jgi:hypothetical protein